MKAASLHRRDLAAERRRIRAARLVICNSRRTRDDVVERIGVDPSRVQVVYYGSDRARFSLVDREERAAAKRALGCAPDRPLVGFVGALGDRRKAFDSLFAAWTRLVPSNRLGCRPDRGGRGSRAAAVAGSAPTAAGLAARVRLVGFRADMPDVLAALDALVHPARYEAYGLSVHEAICRGVPAIVSRSAGVAEQYPADLDDLLIDDPNDAAELAAQLLRWRCRVDEIRGRVAPLSRTLRGRTLGHHGRRDCRARRTRGRPVMFAPVERCWVCGGATLRRYHQDRLRFPGLRHTGSRAARLHRPEGVAGSLRRVRLWSARGAADAAAVLRSHVRPALGSALGRGRIRGRSKDFIFHRVLRALERRDPSDAPRLLDVGAHAGRFMSLAQQDGWTVEGIELNPRRQRARRGAPARRSIRSTRTRSAPTAAGTTPSR